MATREVRRKRLLAVLRAIPRAVTQAVSDTFGSPPRILGRRSLSITSQKLARPSASSHEHPFSNGDILEKLGIPEITGKLDSESPVDVTTSWSPCRTMVDV